MLYKYLVNEYEKYDLLSDVEKDSMEHVNCCEKILFGINNINNLKLDENALKLARGFGGGMNVEGTCGVITGGVMSISSIYYDNDNYKEIISDFINTYNNKFKSISCDVLREMYGTEEEGCRNVILNAAAILDSIISKYDIRGDQNE